MTLQRARDPQYVFRMMLAVGVGSNNSVALGIGLQHVADTRLEGSTFTQIRRMAQDVNLRRPCTRIEDLLRSGIALVIDEDDPIKRRRGKLLDQRYQLPARTQRRNNDRYIHPKRLEHASVALLNGIPIAA